MTHREKELLRRAMLMHSAPLDLFTARQQHGWVLRKDNHRQYVKGGGLYRDPERIRKRALVWKELRKPVGGITLSYPDIARITTGRSHSTVRAACVKP